MGWTKGFSLLPGHGLVRGWWGLLPFHFFWIQLSRVGNKERGWREGQTALYFNDTLL
jgi:hypothetical protein